MPNNGAYPLVRTLIEARSQAGWMNPATPLLSSYA